MLLPTPRPTIAPRATVARPERRQAAAALLDLPSHTDRLQPFLREAARLDLDDRDGWETLRGSAGPHLAALIEAGRLPPHLALDAPTPPVVTARVLAVAWRRLAGDGRPGR